MALGHTTKMHKLRLDNVVKGMKDQLAGLKRAVEAGNCRAAHDFYQNIVYMAGEAWSEATSMHPRGDLMTAARIKDKATALLTGLCTIQRRQMNAERAARMYPNKVRVLGRR